MQEYFQADNKTLKAVLYLQPPKRSRNTRKVGGSNVWTVKPVPLVG